MGLQLSKPRGWWRTKPSSESVMPFLMLQITALANTDAAIKHEREEHDARNDHQPGVDVLKTKR